MRAPVHRYFMRSAREQGKKSAISKCFESTRGPQFKRATMVLKRQEIVVGQTTGKTSDPAPTAIIDFSKLAPSVTNEEFAVLVINSSHDMAKEITLQLTLGIPGCSIMYAPTIELAKWILKRRKIRLVVSSPVLFDGGINRLKDTLEDLDAPPEVVVVGNMNINSAELFSKSRYEFSSYRRIGANRSESAPVKPEQRPRKLETTIKLLGADIRNDLNNPLQEIVAMVFVAQNSAQSAQTEQALTAIDTAAKNMSNVVNALEEKIRGAVGK